MPYPTASLLAHTREVARHLETHLPCRYVIEGDPRGGLVRVRNPHTQKDYLATFAENVAPSHIEGRVQQWRQDGEPERREALSP